MNKNHYYHSALWKSLNNFCTAAFTIAVFLLLIDHGETWKVVALLWCHWPCWS